MNIIVHVSAMIHPGAITGRHSGRVMREAVAAAMEQRGTVVVDFADVEMITQSAADEFIGRIMREHPEWIRRMRFDHCEPGVQEMIQWAADHADAVYRAQEPAHA